MSKYIMSLDAGTTSSRTIIFTKEGKIAGISQQEFEQIFPHAGWVEHDPMEIWQTQAKTMAAAMSDAGASADDIAAIGITNQRETTVVWDKTTGKPVYNAIVWQCRRTAETIEKLKADGLGDYVKETTGLIPDPYFSGSKIAWILDNVDGARKLADEGKLLFGTIDTWLAWNLTGGVHVTDVTNASRTMLYDIHNLCWDEKLLAYFNIPKSMLPEVVMSSEIIGTTDGEYISKTAGVDADLNGITVSGMIGDQQAALMGNCCFKPGDIKNTYGTGCFTLMNTGNEAIESKHGLLTTIAVGLGGKVSYAIEGSVFVAGAAVQWLRDQMQLITKASESEACCNAVESTEGVYVVPAFSGLGAPYWNPYARGGIFGITRGTNKNHIIRATVESLAFQVYDLVNAMKEDLGEAAIIDELKVDGGASANNFLMQFQSNLLGIDIERPSCVETTALGASYMAGLAVGFWSSLTDIESNRSIDRTFTSEISEEERARLLDGWKRAVAAVNTFDN